MRRSNQDETTSALSRATTPAAIAAVVVLFAGLLWNAQQKAPSGGETHICANDAPSEKPAILPPAKR